MTTGGHRHDPRHALPHRPAAPKCCSWEEVAVGDPGAGEARIRQHGHRPELHRHLPPHRPLPGCRCPRASAWRAPAWSRRWAPASSDLKAGRPRRLRRRPARRLRRGAAASRPTAWCKLPDGDRLRRRPPAMMLQGPDRRSTCCAAPTACRPGDDGPVPRRRRRRRA
ncbi:MAG: hypothetical protein MZW92_60605 [Comamonadaceae bacterium]|nr:hypothetical protein [Comamonadaceae bacterium]